MKKISKKDLYWGLSHKDEKVYKPVFEYRVRQWLCHPAPVTKEQVINWQNDEQLLKLLTDEELEKRMKEALLAVIATAPQLNYNRFDSIVSVMGVSWPDDMNSKRVLPLIEVIRRLHAEADESAELKDYLDGYVGDLSFSVNNGTLYQLVPAAMQFPEIYDVLKEKIEGSIDLSGCGTLVKDLLEKAYVHRDKTHDLLRLVFLVVHKCGNEFFDYLLLLQDFNRKNDIYSRELKEECLKIIADHGVFVDEQWLNLLSFATSGFDDETVCRFGIEWRLKVCDILWERLIIKNKEQEQDFLKGLRKLAKDTPAHGLSKLYLPLFRKFIKEFPQDKPQVLDVIDLIVGSYAKTVCPEGAYDNVWAVYNIGKYRFEAVDLIKYGLQLAVSKDIDAEKRWKYTHIMLEMILYCPTIDIYDYERKINKMLSYQWRYDHCAGQMVRALTVYVKIGKKDMTNRMQLVKSLIFPIIDKMLNFYPLAGDEEDVAEFCRLYMPLRPDYWRECQSKVAENLRRLEDERLAREAAEADRARRLLEAIAVS